MSLRRYLWSFVICLAMVVWFCASAHVVNAMGSGSEKLPCTVNSDCYQVTEDYSTSSDADYGYSIHNYTPTSTGIETILKKNASYKYPSIKLLHNTTVSATTTPVDPEWGSSHGHCRYLSNTSSNDYFVPFKTRAEWEAFVTYKPSGVVWSSTNKCARPFHGVNIGQGIYFGPSPYKSPAPQLSGYNYVSGDDPDINGGGQYETQSTGAGSYSEGYINNVYHKVALPYWRNGNSWPVTTCSTSRSGDKRCHYQITNRCNYQYSYYHCFRTVYYSCSCNCGKNGCSTCTCSYCAEPGSLCGNSSQTWSEYFNFNATAHDSDNYSPLSWSGVKDSDHVSWSGGSARLSGSQDRPCYPCNQRCQQNYHTCSCSATSCGCTPVASSCSWSGNTNGGDVYQTQTGTCGGANGGTIFLTKTCNGTNFIYTGGYGVANCPATIVGGNCQTQCTSSKQNLTTNGCSVLFTEVISNGISPYTNPVICTDGVVTSGSFSPLCADVCPQKTPCANGFTGVMAIIVDASGSIGSDFTAEQNLVNSIMAGLTAQNGGSLGNGGRVHLFVMGSSVVHEMECTGATCSIPSQFTPLNATFAAGADSNTDLVGAINAANSWVSGTRNALQQGLIVLVTDGAQTVGLDAGLPAATLRQNVENAAANIDSATKLYIGAVTNDAYSGGVGGNMYCIGNWCADQPTESLYGPSGSSVLGAINSVHPAVGGIQTVGSWSAVNSLSPFFVNNACANSMGCK